MGEQNGTVVRQCGNCVHWHRSPANRMNIADIRGDCRRHPPQVTILVGQGTGGQVSIVGQVSAFPSLPEKHVACGEFTKLVRLVVE